MIEITDLHKSFNGQQILRGVDLTIPKGKITVIIGPPGRGRIAVDGVELSRLKGMELNDFRRRFGMLFQSAALFDSLTVAENVAFPLVEQARLGKRADIARIAEEKL